MAGTYGRSAETPRTSLAADALNEYVRRVGSAVFACPPGVSSGQHWDDGLFT